MHFEWDPVKAAQNLAKHQVTFEEAARAFADPQRLTSRDERHTAEPRENTTGQVENLLVLTVTHTDRAGRTRIISARRASRNERKNYHEQND